LNYNPYDTVTASPVSGIKTFWRRLKTKTISYKKPKTQKGIEVNRTVDYKDLVFVSSTSDIYLFPLQRETS
jgi:hypothetical protein